MIPLIMFLVICLALLLGFPVAFTLGGVALIFAALGIIFQSFDLGLLGALPQRLFGVLNNSTLMAVPLFVMMGITLERAKIAEDMLVGVSQAFGRVRAGLALAVICVGSLLAASTGIIGATVVTMGLLSLPSMMRNGYPNSVAAGTICATGTLGQIVPPSIALVLLGDTLSTAYQQAQLKQGIFSGESISVGDLFIGALLPAVLLIICYLIYVLIRLRHTPPAVVIDIPEHSGGNSQALWQIILAPLALIVAVLGSILAGAATPTEAAGIGAFGALMLAALKGQLSIKNMREIGSKTVEVTSMVFMILLGATMFSLVFRGFGGEELVEAFFQQLPGGAGSALLVVMLAIFLLGFILDFIEITFVVVPIVGPILLAMGIDPVWLGILIALNLQTSFLTPPFGFALFYLRGVAPAQLETEQIYRGVLPFIVIQLLVLSLVVAFPDLATWLPNLIN